MDELRSQVSGVSMKRYQFLVASFCLDGNVGMIHNYLRRTNTVESGDWYFWLFVDDVGCSGATL